MSSKKKKVNKAKNPITRSALTLADEAIKKRLESKVTQPPLQSKFTIRDVDAYYYHTATIAEQAARAALALKAIQEDATKKISELTDRIVEFRERWYGNSCPFCKRVKDGYTGLRQAKTTTNAQRELP